jgi:hypothetical protein
MIGSIIFAASFSVYFGDYVKEWRLFADVINDVGQSLDMLCSYVPSHLYLPILSVSAICKAMCGISAGATKLCITNHLSLDRNSSDLNAKESTQETAVTLIGLLFGIYLAKYILIKNELYSNLLFILLTMLHVYANYKAVSCLKFDTINKTRCDVLLSQYATSNKNKTTHIDFKNSDKMSIDYINSLDSIWHTLNSLCCSKIYMAPRLSTALQNFTHKQLNNDKLLLSWEKYQNYFINEQFCIIPCKRYGGLSVLMKRSATKVMSY